MRAWMNLCEAQALLGIEWNDGFTRWWIHEDGKVVEVNDHHETSSDVFGNEEFEHDDDIEHTSAIRSALESGWIQLRSGGETFQIVAANWMPGRASDAAFRSLSRMIARMPEADVYVLGPAGAAQSKKEALSRLR